jgi:putative two-component system response regulator
MTTVLFVDDEHSVLRALERAFQESGLRVLTADSAEKALQLVGHEEVAVVVSDYMMPQMNGIELLTRIRSLSPDTVRVMMTAHADLPTAIAAINRSEAFRFITKPWSNDELLVIVDEAAERYEVVRSLREGNESRYRSIAQTIELKDAYTRGHCDRVAEYATLLAEELGLADTLIRDIRFGSWLHDCGKIGVPEVILNFEGRLAIEQFELVKQHPLWGSEVARQARMSQAVINIILHHHERFDGLGYPAGLKGEQIPLEARIVGIADVLDALYSDRPYRKAHMGADVLRILGEMSGTFFDPQLMEVFMPIAERICLP